MDELLLTQKAWMVFANLILLVVLYFIYKPASKGVCISPVRKKRGLFLVLVFCLFSFWGTDWFHYQDLYIDLRNDSFRITHIENVYVWIIQNIPGGYIMFRFIVWGAALVLFYNTLKRLAIDRDLAMFLFVTMSLIWFSYARVSLPMSLLFWGASIITEDQKMGSFLRTIMGLVAIVVSYFLHKSSLFGMAMILLSLLMNQMDRRFYLVLLILFPVSVLIVKGFLGDIMMLDFSRENSEFEAYMISAQGYMDRDRAIRGLGASLQRLLEIIPYYLSVFLCIKLKNSFQFNSLPSGIKLFINISLLTVFFSSVFLFIEGPNTSLIYIRFLRYGFIPVIIVLAYCWRNQLYKKLTLSTWRIGFVGALYAVTYSLYNTLV